MSDERAFLAAIRDNPDDDNVRLVYADWLDERDEVRVPCPRCATTPLIHCRNCDGTGDNTGDYHASRRCNWCDGEGAYPPECDVCEKTRTVLDTGDRDRAELIRVQVELAKVFPVEPGGMRAAECTACWARRTTRQHTNGACKCHRDLRRLVARESALLAAYPELFPPCPVCDGTSQRNYGPWSGLMPCDACSGSGRVGEYRRGMLCVTVPTLGVLFGRCKACGGSGTHCGVSEDANPGTCDRCGGTGWRLTRWGRDLRDQFPQVVEVHVADAVPSNRKRGPRGERCEVWFADDAFPEQRTGDRSLIPRFLMPRPDMRRWNHKTTELARLALARAVAGALFSEDFK